MIRPQAGGALATPCFSRWRGDAQRGAFVVVIGDDLHADRQAARPLQRRHHDRQADEGDRLGVEAEIGAHRQLDAAQLHHDLAELGRGAGRGRRQDDVDLVEQLLHLGAIVAAETLRLDVPGAGQQRARHEALARVGIEILRPRPEARQMELAALDGGDDIGGRARRGGLRDRRWSWTRRAPWPRSRPPPAPRARRPGRNSRRRWRCAGRRCPRCSSGKVGSAGRSVQTGSSGSQPCMASNDSARSSTERASGPRWSKASTKGKEPARLSRP